MACRRIARELPIFSRKGENIFAPLAAVQVRSYSVRKDVEKTTHTGQVSLKMLWCK